MAMAGVDLSNNNKASFIASPPSHTTKAPQLCFSFSSASLSSHNSVAFDGFFTSRHPLLSKLKPHLPRSPAYPPLSSISAIYVDDEDYLLDAPITKGDGFSFAGGKYSDEKDASNEWFAKGKVLFAYQVQAKSGTAKEPIFGLAMGEASQIAEDAFRWFFVEEGDPSKPSVLLLHGLPSQAYSFRKVLPVLSADHHVIALDWLGFGFSDKPLVEQGFNYSRTEYAEALKSVLVALNIERTAIAVQGYFAPAVVEFAYANQDKVSQLILINPPLTEKHTTLPSTLSCFSTFLLGEIFAQDPLRASDKPLSDCGHYMLDEEDAMVYRRPYLTSGAAGFSLTAITRTLSRELKDSIDFLRKVLVSSHWSRPTTILWGAKDRWLNSSGVEELASTLNIKTISLSEVGHHAQEDYGEEVGRIIHMLLKRI